MTSVDADLRSGRRSDSIIYIMILCLSIKSDTTTNYKCFVLLENAKSAIASVFVVGTDGVCSPSDGQCNGYLDPGQLYRYIIRIHMHTNISLKYIFYYLFG